MGLVLRFKSTLELKLWLGVEGQAGVSIRVSAGAWLGDEDRAGTRLEMGLNVGLSL